jgi:hypothetical protein
MLKIQCSSVLSMLLLLGVELNSHLDPRSGAVAVCAAAM